MPNQFENVFDYDMQITFKNGLGEEKQSYIQELQNKEEIQKVVETYMTSSTVAYNGNEEDVQVIIPKDEGSLSGIINLKDVQTKEMVKLQENEICLTDKVAQLIGVKAGDTITLRDSDDNEVEVKISNVADRKSVV